MRHRLVTSRIGLDLIQRFEGFSPTVYVCPAGYPTIGYGHLVRAGEVFPDGGISRYEAERLLARDVITSELAVARLIAVPLTQSQFDALVSFTYNLGGGALQRSSLRMHLNRGCYGVVPEELLRWVWAGGRKLPGLVKRRVAEGERFQQS
jgi:lysozyme